MRIKKYQEDFQIIHENYYLYVMDDEVKDYNDVEDKTWKKEVEEEC